MTEKHRLIANTLANGAAQFASMATALVFMPLLIRTFGLTEYGLYLLASTIGSYAAILDFGVGAALVKHVAESAARREDRDTERFASTALAFYVVVGLAVAAILAAFALLSADIFKLTADEARLLRNLLLVMAASSLWSWPMATSNYILAGLQKYTTTARTALGVALGSAVVALAVVVLNEGPLVLVCGNVLMGLIGGLVNTYLAVREFSGRRISIKMADTRIFRRIVSFSWPVFVIQVCVLIVYQQTDRIVIGIFLGATSVALYESAGKFQGLITQLVTFANSAVMPVSSQLQAQGRMPALQTLFLRGSKYVSVLVYPVVVALIILARPIIESWLGPAFTDQALAAQVFLSYQLLNAGISVGDNIITGMGRLRDRLPNAVGIITIGNLALSLILVTRYGILGVVIGTAVPYFIDYPLHIRYLLRTLDIPFSRWLRENVLPVYPGLLITLAISVVALYTPLVDSLPGIAAAMALAVGAYWASVFTFGMTAVERGEIAALLARIRVLRASR